MKNIPLIKEENTGANVVTRKGCKKSATLSSYHAEPAQKDGLDFSGASWIVRLNTDRKSCYNILKNLTMESNFINQNT